MNGIIFVAALTLIDSFATPQRMPQRAPYLNIVGTYTSDTLWHYRFMYIRDTPGAMRVDDFSCPGTITITEQDFQKFAGRFTQSAPCPAVSGTVTGWSRLVPQVRFSIRAGTDFVETMERMTGCSKWTGGYELPGTIVPTAMGIQARTGGQLHCPGGRAGVNFEVSSFTKPAKPKPKPQPKTKKRLRKLIP